MSGGSGARPVLWLSTHAVQLAVPIGDDGQLMSGGSSAWPVLWLSTNAVQLTVAIGDDGQLMSSASGALFSVLLVHFSLKFVRLFRTSSVPLFRSSNFSVPVSFLFVALQTLPFP